jgi:hypothetical protein
VDCAIRKSCATVRFGTGASTDVLAILAFLPKRPPGPLPDDRDGSNDLRIAGVQNGPTGTVGLKVFQGFNQTEVVTVAGDCPMLPGGYGNEEVIAVSSTTNWHPATRLGSIDVEQ